MKDESRRNYWETVRQCLRRLHGFTSVRANSSIREFKDEVSRDHTENAVYHEEPYVISCEIAGVECDYGTQWDAYQSIRAEYFSVAENVVRLAERRGSAPLARKPGSQSRIGDGNSSNFAATGVEGSRTAKTAGYQAASKKAGAKKSGARKSAGKKTTSRKSDSRKGSGKRSQ